MALSHYNRAHDRILAADLTETELRLALAFVRCLLGWKREGGIPNEGRLGRAHLMATARIGDRRTFERARAALVHAGIVEVLEPGTAGRGNRTLYRLRLDGEKAAPGRPITGVEKAAPQRPNPEDGKGRSQSTKKAAVERPRKGESRGKTVPASPGKVDPELLRRAFDAFTGAGGSSKLERERGALARGVASLVQSGLDERTILAACREIGRRGTFPGYLRQVAESFAESGGPCDWDGLDRSRLTQAQLAACPCPHCAEWLAAVAVA